MKTRAVAPKDDALVGKWNPPSMKRVEWMHTIKMRSPSRGWRSKKEEV